MPVLIDSNVIIDVLTRDLHWYAWSAKTLEKIANEDALYINPVIYAEVSVCFDTIEELERALPESYIYRAPLPYEAAFLAAKCFLQYRKRGGAKSAPLPDFYIGAHAAVKNWRLLTRDKGRYATYFPGLAVIMPTEQ
ncbi:MAG: type II toxin-antitoxin system VapC family toxin [Rickettsiales bacterium]